MLLGCVEISLVWLGCHWYPLGWPRIDGCLWYSEWFSFSLFVRYPPEIDGSWFSPTSVSQDIYPLYYEDNGSTLNWLYRHDLADSQKIETL